MKIPARSDANQARRGCLVLCLLRRVRLKRWLRPLRLLPAGVLLQGQGHHKGGHPVSTQGLDGASVESNDLLGDGQPKSRPAGAGSPGLIPR